MKAVIVGGGIAGLSAALCLNKAGWSVQILEQAPKISEVGAGLQISSNGYHVLRALGVASRLETAFYHPKTLELRDGFTGNQHFSIPIGEIAEPRYGAPYVQVHRADLVDALLDQLLEQSPDCVTLGARVVSYGQDANHAYVDLEDGQRIQGDIVIGADGLHSHIRKQMHGADQPRFTGNVAWRSLVPLEQLTDAPPPDAGCIWAGRTRHAVTTKIRGGNVVNFVGIVEQHIWMKEGWSQIGERNNVMREFKGWHPTIQEILTKAKVHNRWGLFDRAPLSHWSEGRVALIGDACHPMLPSLAQGAVQSLEDAWVLAEKLRDNRDLTKGLQEYFDARIERTARIQQRSAKNVDMFHAATPLQRIKAFGPIKAAKIFAPSLFYKSQDWVWGANVTQK
jgi:salicylate hydroxylase